MRPDEALARVLGATGLRFPRGLVGAEVRELAALMGDPLAPSERVRELAGTAAAVHWAELRGPMEAAVRRGLSDADAADAPAFEMVLAWAGDPDPDNPLARALAVRAAVELRAAVDRAIRYLDRAEEAIAEGGASAAVAATTTAGLVAMELLDLDPDDYEPEILAYVDSDGTPEALERLARSTGEREIRDWARRELLALESPDTPQAREAVHQLAADPAPTDPVADLVWVPTILALTQRALELAAVSGGEEADARV